MKRQGNKLTEGEINEKDTGEKMEDMGGGDEKVWEEIKEKGWKTRGANQKVWEKNSRKKDERPGG